MARERITEAKIRRVPIGKSKSFGRGLTIFHTKAGNYIWRLRYSIEGKWKIASLGNFPDIPVTEIEAVAAEFRRKIAEGVSPTDERREERERERREEEQRKADEEHRRKHTFKKAYERYLKIREEGISESHYRRLLLGFGRDCKELHDIPLDEITPDQVARTWGRLVYAKKYESAKKLRYALSDLFEMAKGWPDWRIEENVVKKKGLGYKTKDTSPASYPALHKEEDHERIRELYRRICDYENGVRRHEPTAWALRVLMLLGTRPSVVRLMEWEWLDFDNKLLRVPWTTKGIKKRRSEAKTAETGDSPTWNSPLSEEVVEVLKRAKEWRDQNRPGCRFVFPTYRSSCAPISDAGFGVALRGIWSDVEGEKIVPHGFRSTLSTVAKRFRLDLYLAIEKQLGHAVETKVAEIYNKGDFIEARRELLEWWSAWLKGEVDE